MAKKKPRMWDFAGAAECRGQGGMVDHRACKALMGSARVLCVTGF